MRYATGQWYGLVSGSGCVILAPDSTGEKVTSVWAALRSGSGFAQLLQRMVGDAAADLTALPAFAIAVPESGGIHIAVRGPLSVRAMTTGGPVLISGADVLTWKEDRILAPSQLSVAADEDGGLPSWVLNDGIVPVSCIDMLPGGGDWSDSAPVHSVVTSTPGTGLAALNVPDTPSPAAVAAQGEQSNPAGHAAPVSPVPAVPPPAHGPAAPPHPGSPQGEPVTPPSGTPPAPVQSRDEQDLHYTTLYRSFFEGPAAANQAAENLDPGNPDLGNPASTAPVQSAAETQLTMSPPPGGPAYDPGLARTNQPYEDEDDHDGMTVMSAPGFGEGPSTDHDGMTTHTWVGDQVAASPVPSPAGPMVSARICPRCHSANSTRRVTCRFCDSPLDVDATQVPRPILGRLKLPGGDVRPIDHPFVIGRRPEATRFSNLDIPNLITVEDPHVSATHLRVDLEDWSVLVTSLGRNGTILRRVGQPDRRLTDGQQEIAQEKDVYFLSHDLMVTIEELA
ncbi:MAG: FHA domain-containing protein [Propionibacteriaceae bacterium]|nr:FHA domain-containing protein [Propionibacteriaceae bacterium]